MFSKTKNIAFKKIMASTLLVTFTGLSASAIDNVKLKSAQTPTLSGSVGVDTMKINSSAYITQSNQKISLSLRDSDVKQVLRMFATKAKMNIIFHDSVNGKITLDLIEIPINEAFELVLDTMGLTYYKDGKTLVVAKNDANAAISVAKRNLTTLPVKYVNAADIANFLNKNVYGQKMMGLSTGEIATVNSLSNELIIFGSDADIDAAKKIIEKFDKQQSMKTFIVSHTTPKEMAELICNAFYTQGSGSSGGSSPSGGSSGFGSSGDGSDPASDPASGDGTATGFGASSGSGSGGGGSTSPVTDVKLGGGTVACSIDKATVQSQHSAFGKLKSQVVYFPQHGTISVYGASDEQLKMITQFIQDNDKKQLMAYLEMSILELNEKGIKELSTKWQLDTPIASFLFDGKNFSIGEVQYGATSNPYDSSDSNLYPTQIFGQLNGTPAQIYGNGGFFPHNNGATRWTPAVKTSLGLTLTSLLENGNARTLANPKMMITNGQKTVLDMTSDYIESVDAEMQENQSTLSGPLVERTFNLGNDLGLKIELMPFITPDGYVNFNIRPSYSTIKDQPMYDLTGTGQQEIVATLLQRRNIELNNLRVKDGETLVIAGLIDESEKQTSYKVPFFGDLPLVGFLFRSSSNTKTKSELVIMLTPHIVYDDDDVPENL